MPMFDSHARKCGCSIPKGIQWYLEEKVPGRARARGFCNLLSSETERWDKAFDHTRMMHGNHLPYHGKTAVQYTHFDLDPDPLDNPTAEEVLEYARDWAVHFFGDGGEAGVLGCFQVAIVIHDDNENGIMHAHVVVNNTDLATGRRLQIDDEQNERGLPDYAQDLARERGWRYFDNTPDHRWTTAEAHLPLSKRRAMLPGGSTRTIAERRMAERGKPVWKDELRTRVAVAKNVSQTEEQFVLACAELGVQVRMADGDCVFGMPFQGASVTSSGQNLGAVYFGAGVQGRRTLAMQMPSKDAARLRENVLAAMEAAQSVSVAVPGASGVSQRQIAVCIATMRKHGITNAASLDRALKRCGVRVGKTAGADKKRQQREYARIKKVEELASRIGLFDGVGDGANRAARIRELEAQGAASGEARTAEELARLRAEERRSAPGLVLPAQRAGRIGAKSAPADDDAVGGDGRAQTPGRAKR